MTTSAPPVIDIRDVSRTYGEGPPALAGVSLSVRAGEALAVLGPSGSGKSTLLNLIAGLDRPSGGSVTVDGQRVDRLGEAASAKYRRARIGMVFQFFNLLEDLTVADNVLLPAQLAGTPAPRPADAPPTCSPTSASTGTRTPIPAGCPAGNGNGWPSPAP